LPLVNHYVNEIEPAIFDRLGFALLAEDSWEAGRKCEQNRKSKSHQCGENDVNAEAN
jgi:hypothetical protein